MYVALEVMLLFNSCSMCKFYKCVVFCSCEISSTKWVLYVQYIPTHVPHVVFHVEMSILPYGDLHLAQALD